MSATSVQFTVAAHIMAALGYFHSKEISSAVLAESVNADPTFVRKSFETFQSRTDHHDAR
jgi:DNA-binding IscR family transcriptional regulator